MIEHYKNDLSTVFSISPTLIHEFKPGLYPGDFTIPACLNDAEPNRLLIGASEHIIHIGGRRQPMRIVTPSFQIAESLVRDYLEGQLWTTPTAHPGICWVAGNVDLEQFKKVHNDLYTKMRVAQKAWYVQVCKKTDDEWKRYRNSRVVSDQARFAARALGLEPEWMNVETVGFTFSKCPACSTPNSNDNAICTNCKCVLDEKKFEKLKFAS